MTDALPHRHLLTLTLAVDFASVTAIGATAAGQRGIAPVTGGSFAGERLNGSVRPGADWFTGRADGMAVDVRLTLDTHDGAAIYLAYTGAMVAAPAVMARFRTGEALDPADYRLRTAAKFECGVKRYRWLNDVLAVGVGEQIPGGVRYTIFEVAP